MLWCAAVAVHPVVMHFQMGCRLACECGERAPAWKTYPEDLCESIFADGCTGRCLGQGCLEEWNPLAAAQLSWGRVAKL